MALWQTNQLKRINLLEGSVSSGKTWISLVLWAFWVKTMPENVPYMMCAKSLTTLKRNCLLLLQDLVGEDNFTFSLSAKEGKLFGRKIFLEGANDARSEAKIRGLTLQGAYCDELTQFPRDFFTMLLSRLRLPEAKIIATTNPDSPSHWLKTEYIDRAEQLNFLDVKFLLDDNSTLPKDYVENIKREYTGVFYERFILGLWVLAEGLIYPNFQEAIAEAPNSPIEAKCLSIDYGTQNPFAALLWEKHGGVWYAVKEFYYSGRATNRQKTDDEYGEDMDKFVEPYLLPDEKLETIIDPSAASFIALLKKKSWSKVRTADNAVEDGIRETASAMHRGLIKFSPTLRNWRKECESYVWEEGTEKPLKENDHCLTGDTIVDTEHGAKPISELVGTSGKVWSYNTETGVAELKPYHDCRLTQKQAEIYEIETEDGRFIRCTGEHPILTERGYVLAKDLRKSDKIIDISDSTSYNVDKGGLHYDSVL